jgi:hypothetical protein
MIDNEQLENPDVWDFDRAESRPPVRGRRSIVSVALLPADLEVISKCAQEAGMKLSEFIREAALDKCRSHPSQAELSGATFSGKGTFVFTSIHRNETRSTVVPDVPDVAIG